jgi:hypothetical protein
VTGNDVEICARCERLKTEGYPDKLKQGHGYCQGHQNDSPSHGPFAAWNDRACVLFIRAKDMVLRQRWIERRQAKQEQLQIQTAMKG